MLYRRAVLIAIAAYVTSFAIGILFRTLILQGVIPAGPALPQVLLAVQLISIIAIGTFFTWWYFRSPAAEPSWQRGLALGAVMIAVGFVFDALLALPLVFAGIPFSVFLSIYTDPMFWVSLVLLLATATGTAALLARGDLGSIFSN